MDGAWKVLNANYKCMHSWGSLWYHKTIPTGGWPDLQLYSILMINNTIISRFKQSCPPITRNNSECVVFPSAWWAITFSVYKCVFFPWSTIIRRLCILIHNNRSSGNVSTPSLTGWIEQWANETTSGAFFIHFLAYAPLHFCELNICCCHISLSYIRSSRGEMLNQRWAIHYCASQMYSEFRNTPWGDRTVMCIFLTGNNSDK